MTVVESLERELKLLGPTAAESTLAASALAIAHGIDAGCSLAQMSLAAKELRDCLRELRTLAPPKKQEDRVDEIAKRRERRITRAAH
jgi:hypothetical protein